MKMKFVLIFCITFIGYVNCNCGIPRREPDPPEKLKEEYLDMILRRNEDLDEPYRRPFCTEEEQILWSFRGFLVTMPSDLRSKMLNARRKGLPWEPYEAQMKEKKVAPVSLKPTRCGLIRRKQKPNKQVMEDYLDLVLQNSERLVRPPCRPFCIEEEQIMWLLREKLETMSSQLKSDILDARRNKRPWLNLLKPKKKSTEAPKTTVNKKEIPSRKKAEDNNRKTLPYIKTTTVRTTTTKKPTTVSKKPVFPSTPRAIITISTTKTTPTKLTTLSSTPKQEKKIESTPKMPLTNVSSGAKLRRESEKSETMKLLTEMTASTTPSTTLKMTTSTSPTISSTTSSKLISSTSVSTTPSSTTTSSTTPSPTTSPTTMMNTTTEGSTTSAMMTTILLEHTPKIKRRFGESDTFGTSDTAKFLTTTSKSNDVIDKLTSTAKATNVTDLSSTTVATTSMTDTSSSKSGITSMTGISSTSPGIADSVNTSITTLETTTKAAKATSTVGPCFDPSELYDLTGNSIDIPMHEMMKTKRPGCKS